MTLPVLTHTYFEFRLHTTTSSLQSRSLRSVLEIVSLDRPQSLRLVLVPFLSLRTQLKNLFPLLLDYHSRPLFQKWFHLSPDTSLNLYDYLREVELQSPLTFIKSRTVQYSVTREFLLALLNSPTFKSTCLYLRLSPTVNLPYVLHFLLCLPKQGPYSHLTQGEVFVLPGKPLKDLVFGVLYG